MSLLRFAQAPFLPTLVLSFAAACRIAASSTGTATELSLTADLDADGRPDVVIVDRASGAYRIGYQLAPDVFTWVPARASGIAQVTGAAAGRVLALDRSALVFTSPAANRVNVLAADLPLDPGEPLSLFPPGIGPSVAVPLDIPGNNNSGHDDLAVATTENGAPATGRLVQWRNLGGTVSVQAEGALTAIPRQGAAVQLKAGGEVFLGLLEQIGNTHQYRNFRPGAHPPVVISGASSVPGDGFVFGRFTAGPLHHFLFVQRGVATVTARAVTEALPNQFAFGPVQVLDLGVKVGQLTVLGTTPARLLVVSEDGQAARELTWDGGNGLAVAEDWQAPAGQAWTGALALPGGSFHLFRGAPGTGISTGFQPFKRVNGVAQPGTPGLLPPVNARALAANVFLFANEPFVAPVPRLLGALNAAEWSDSATLLGNPAQLQAVAERFGTSAEGLDQPQNRALGTVPPGTAFTLVNQYRPVISALSLAAAAGDLPVDVQIRPPAGLQRTAVEVTFAPVPAEALIFYRLGGAGAAWTSFNGKPVALTGDTTVEFYGQLPGSDRKSALQRATYVFPQPPGGLDSDGDGVPDVVERGAKLDPLAGADTDGDGFTDKNELLAGTDPKNGDPNVPGAVPKASQRLDEDGAFDVAVGPRPWDGTVSAETAAAVDVELELFALGGGRVGKTATRQLNLAQVPDPGVRFTNVPPDPSVPLLVVGTVPHYDLTTAAPDRRIGRELAGLIAPPQTSDTLVNYTPGNGTPEQELAQWLVAAQAAQNASPRVLVRRRLTALDTLVAVLLERRVNELLVARGIERFKPDNLTLFPFRAGDASRLMPTAEELAGLRVRLDNAQPGHDLAAMLAALEAAILPPGQPGMEPLRQVALDVYGISSRLHNASPGSYAPPLEVLRRFVRTGVLDATYATVATVPPATRAAAFAAAEALVGSLPVRPTATFDLTVIPDGESAGCTTLQVTGAETFKNLVVPGGAPFQFPAAFELLPGTRVEVFAYTDALPTGCPGEVLEVITAGLLALPPEELVDVNANLLPDAWECFFFGGGGKGGGDGDGDGFSNLQELLDGTDPMDPNSKGQKAVKLDLPPMAIELGEGGNVVVKFNFPPAYLKQFQFTLQGTEELEDPFVPLSLANPAPDGTYALLLPAVQKVRSFYRLEQKLK